MDAEKIRTYREDLNRWLDIRHELFSFVHNLLLTFAVAILGFISYQFLGLFNDPELLWGLFFILLSIGAGIGLVFARLGYYKYKIGVLKKKIEAEMIKEDQQADNSVSADPPAGKRTWILLWVQLAAFLLGCFLIMLFVYGYHKGNPIGHRPF
jgi:hypothetical protein